MMNRTTKRLFVAGSIGLLISGGFYVLANEPNTATATAFGKVLLVNEHIAASTVIEAKHFTVETRPLPYIPPGAIASPELVIGRHAKWDMVAGDPLTDEKLLKPEEAALTALPIPKGKRAVTVKVDEVVGVAGFIQPNSMVDVIGTWDVTGTPHSKVILQNIQVLAVAQEAEKPNEPKARVTSSVTLSVSPSEAEKIILSTERGSIRLAMRSPDESGQVTTAGITPAALTGIRPKPPVRAAIVKAVAKPKAPSAPTPPPVVIFRGGQSDEVRYR